MKVAGYAETRFNFLPRFLFLDTVRNYQWSDSLFEDAKVIAESFFHGIQPSEYPSSMSPTEFDKLVQRCGSEWEDILPNVAGKVEETGAELESCVQKLNARVIEFNETVSKLAKEGYLDSNVFNQRLPVGLRGELAHVATIYGNYVKAEAEWTEHPFVFYKPRDAIFVPFEDLPNTDVEGKYVVTKAKLSFHASFDDSINFLLSNDDTNIHGEYRSYPETGLDDDRFFHYPITEDIPCGQRAEMKVIDEKEAYDVNIHVALSAAIGSEITIGGHFVDDVFYADLFATPSGKFMYRRDIRNLNLPYSQFEARDDFLLATSGINLSNGDFFKWKHAIEQADGSAIKVKGLFPTEVYDMPLPTIDSIGNLQAQVG